MNVEKTIVVHEYVLKLTPEEASYLQALAGNVGGAGPVGDFFFFSLYFGLQKEGVATVPASRFFENLETIHARPPTK